MAFDSVMYWKWKIVDEFLMGRHGAATFHVESVSKTTQGSIVVAESAGVLRIKMPLDVAARLCPKITGEVQPGDVFSPKIGINDILAYAAKIEIEFM